MKHALRRPVLALALVAASASALAADARPWLDASRTPDERARLAVAAMTLPEKIGLLHGPMAVRSLASSRPQPVLPADAVPAAGYIAGVPRLGIPALTETDASLGVTNPGGARPGDVATALPSSLALAASFNPELAFRGGVMLGQEAHAKGFNVLLGGGMNLARDPRNGRNFEYLGEDPWLAGVIAGEVVRGTQSQHVISTVKHFALNANETNRRTLDARIDKAALRESDLLAFQLAIERGQPGAVMCAYNLVNGAYACGNDWLLNQVLKRDWHYPGWVMSDWGTVRSPDEALAGLDQQSGEQIDAQAWFGEPLAAAVAAGKVPMSRIDDMATRILRSEFAAGIVDHPPQKADIDYKANAAVALEQARQGTVLLRNEGGVLPFARGLKRIAVIGGLADAGVPSGGGSAQATPSNGAAIIVHVGSRDGQGDRMAEQYMPSSPLAAIKAQSPGTQVLFDAGQHPADAAALARSADVAVVFVTNLQRESFDVPDMVLPHGQDALVEAVAAANPRTIVVLETGNAVAMPWIGKVAGVLAAWYPGQEGGQAVAEILFGAVNPSGRLPVTFPVDDAHTVRPKLPNLGAEPGAQVAIDYTEGADVGYRWHAKSGVQPLYPFGHGLGYGAFAYEGLGLQVARNTTLRFTVRNTSARAGADVPQLYLVSAAGKPVLRLVGFARVELQPGERKEVQLELDPRLLASFDEARGGWRLAGGVYRVALARSATDLVATQDFRLAAREIR